MIIEALSLILKNALPSHCSLGTARILVTHRSPMSLFGSMQIKKTIIFRFRFPQIVVRTAIFAFSSVTILCSRKCISSCKNRFFYLQSKFKYGIQQPKNSLGPIRKSSSSGIWLSFSHSADGPSTLQAHVCSPFPWYLSLASLPYPRMH